MTKPNHRIRSRIRELLAVCALAPIGVLGAGCYTGVDGDGFKPPGGGDDGGPGSQVGGPGTCVDTDQYFFEEVWLPIANTTCIACHNPQGAGKDTDYVLQFSDYPGYLEANLNTIRNVAELEIDGTSLILLKPSGQVDHGGGTVMAQDTEEYKAMEEMVRRFKAPISCTNPDDIAAFYEPVQPLDEEQTLTKAALLLVNRMPTPEELDAVRGQGIDAIDPVLDTMMEEEAFYGRVKEIWNDVFFTDAYLNGPEDAVDLLDDELFPNKRFYDDGAGNVDDVAMAAANTAIAREPLHIIEHVVREGRPFSEILTAPYTIVTPFSGRSYGVDMTMFADQNDPDEKVEYTFSDLEWPLSGVITTHAWLNRFPTTETNRNRARSRWVYNFFLATDILKLAGRPIDDTAASVINPTLNSASCTICHVNMDPIAGALQNWDEFGKYAPRDGGWYADMLPPGFKTTQMPAEDYPRAAQWVTEEIVRSPEFPLAIVHKTYAGITGQPALEAPGDPSRPDYLARIRAWRAQDFTFKEIVTKFQNSNFDYKLLVKEIVKTPWFRAANADELTEQQAEELADMGTARLLPPEYLQRRLQAATGYAWMENGNDRLNEDFKFFYGGIDSFSVTTRLSQMNGVMVNVAERMTQEMACVATPAEFGKAAADRTMLKLVELTDTPNGGETAIRNQIADLHRILLNENLSPDDPEVDRTYSVFFEVWSDGQQGGYGDQLPGPCRITTDPNTGDPLPNPVNSDPDYTARAWMATVTYLLGDAQFLYL